ncbi:MAG: hypothetical protein HC769_25535 [Cyanobacteria bacterium CRU_2_1]|nr:hypothetical protein [Cyanobacteria bacterium RU_5_0]NJR61895.1 hypothetical protein [Cyanobacteria bacterium CRU_2_1]
MLAFKLNSSPIARGLQLSTIGELPWTNFNATGGINVSLPLALCCQQNRPMQGRFFMFMRSTSDV